jgi:alkylation response protein AidB-like acyl-CoA dehydrogenase
VSAFVLSDELDELQRAASRFATEQLAPAARASEAAGRWSAPILTVLDGLAVGGLDVPERLGGVGAGCLAKVVVLEALAAGDAGGLPAADRPGRSVGALVACPDRSLARDVAASDGHAALVVLDTDDARPRVEWAPSWPSLRWAWVSIGNSLRLVEVTAPTNPALALAFGASGGVAVDLTDCPVRGEWTLPHDGGLDVRARARLWAAAVAVGVAQAAFDATIVYTSERIVFGKPVAYHQGNAFELAALATNVHGARLAVRDAAAAYDRGESFAHFWATQAWRTAIDAAIAMTDAGIQLLGGHGFLLDHLAEKRFREARMLGLLAGGRDAADADSAEVVLDVPDLIYAIGIEGP